MLPVAIRDCEYKPMPLVEGTFRSKNIEPVKDKFNLIDLFLSIIEKLLNFLSGKSKDTEKPIQMVSFEENPVKECSLLEVAKQTIIQEYPSNAKPLITNLLSIEKEKTEEHT